MITLSLDRVDKSSFASFASFGPLINNVFIPNDDSVHLQSSFDHRSEKSLLFSMGSDEANDANDPNDVFPTLSGDEAIVEVFL